MKKKLIATRPIISALSLSSCSCLPLQCCSYPFLFYCFFCFFWFSFVSCQYLVCMYSVASKSIKAPLVILAVQYSLHGKLFFSPWLRAFSLKVTFLWVFPPSSITLTTHRTLKKGNKSEKAKKEKKKKKRTPSLPCGLDQASGRVV